MGRRGVRVAGISEQNRTGNVGGQGRGDATDVQRVQQSADSIPRQHLFPGCVTLTRLSSSACTQSKISNIRKKG